MKNTFFILISVTQFIKMNYSYYLKRSKIVVKKTWHGEMTFNTERYESERPVYFPTMAIVT